MGPKISMFCIVTVNVFLFITFQSVVSDDSLDDSHYLSMIVDKMSEMVSLFGMFGMYEAVSDLKIFLLGEGMNSTLNQKSLSENLKNQE